MGELEWWGVPPGLASKDEASNSATQDEPVRALYSLPESHRASADALPANSFVQQVWEVRSPPWAPVARVASPARVGVQSGLRPRPARAHAPPSRSPPQAPH